LSLPRPLPISRPTLKLCGVGTHLAAADMPEDLIGAEQISLFRRVTDHLGGKVMRHAANSAATFFLPDSHFDMIRPGISLYGIDPTASPWLDRTLRPFANDPLSPASAYELAKQAETIPYEILCRIGPRVRRVGVDPAYAKDDPPVQPPYLRRG